MNIKPISALLVVVAAGVVAYYYTTQQKEMVVSEKDETPEVQREEVIDAQEAVDGDGVADTMDSESGWVFDDKMHFEETGLQYIFFRPTTELLAKRANTYMIEGKKSDYPNVESEGLTYGLYKYNPRTEMYERITNEFDTVFNKTSDLIDYGWSTGLFIPEEQFGSRVYMAGFPYEFVIFTPLVYVDLNNLSEGVQDTGYVVYAPRLQLSPDKTKIISYNKLGGQEVSVVDLKDLTAKKIFTAKSDETFYGDSGVIDNLVQPLVSWMSDSQIEIMYRPLTTCKYGITAYDGAFPKCLIKEWEYDSNVGVYSKPQPDVEYPSIEKTTIDL